MPDAGSFTLADVSLATLLLVALVAYVSSVLGGLAGTGVSLLMLPMLVPLVGIKGVIPVIAVAMLLGSTSRLWVFRHSVQWPFVGRILIGATFGVLLGVSIYDWLPADILTVLVGGFLVLSVPARRLFARSERVIRPSPAGTTVFGFGYGIASGTISGGGPILVALLLGMGLRGAAVIGTKAGTSIVMHSLKTIGFGFYGLITLELALAAILIGVCTLPGAYTAKWMVDRMKIKLHTLIVDVAVMFGGVSLLWQLV